MRAGQCSHRVWAVGGLRLAPLGTLSPHCLTLPFLAKRGRGDQLWTLA